MIQRHRIVRVVGIHGGEQPRPQRLESGATLQQRRAEIPDRRRWGKSKIDPVASGEILRFRKQADGDRQRVSVKASSRARSSGIRP